ncbi:hypothetical protein [Spongiactinospora sp. TRM90649]|uniref:hypothetical protein n=1 Tax=Spongiactinospora sp. TRM90649 TaxID=3031114 RepID=UPI0023F7470B|nr:hypothetical protein [Spongiactinospora sp. TRM90649]MDF5759411.1 hypothetical protein [Spongiactinospora sp. TRM90649]
MEVAFDGGARRTFDLVIGAEGLHSNTRGLAFGPEERYHRYLGFCFAGELATHDDHVSAFAAYENTVRDFAEQNQALATAGGGVLAPRTRRHLDARNAMLRTQTTLPSGTEGRAANGALTLPGYEHALAR